MDWTGVTLFTVGHSNRDARDFVDALRAHGVERVVDVRTIPKSRRVPWSAKESLGPGLARESIGYVHEPDLGGRRRPVPGTPNGAWENEGFRGYADHMLTDAFEAALARLRDLAAERPTTVMCAEAVPWRCHRRLISDAVTARGGAAMHVYDARKVERHALTPFARVHADGHVTYPDPQSRLDAGP